MNQQENNQGGRKFPLTLVLLGTGTCVPDVERNSSGYVIASQQTTILLDMGSGTMRRLTEARIDFHNIDGICLTHFHPDHTADLVSFLFATKYTPGFTRTKELFLFGPKGLKRFLANLTALYGDWLKTLEFDLIIQEMDRDSSAIKQLQISTAPMLHAGNCIGYRIEDAAGISITYSGDTGFNNDLIRLAYKTDLLLIECSFPSSQKMDVHLTPVEVGKIAAAAKVKQVVLTHLYPLFDKEKPEHTVQQYFTGKVRKGKDLQIIRLNKE